ncbi:MAG: GNAT family N-acetyltransferase [Acidobacteriota bacterium]|jgi:GNAT superfamily N-acetyltransferase|nr:GNAT family N-acetyltransferase [Acidobacteriota bacterium]NLT34273.1 GNAT family N-acetyltransferase [Acidobacteriota bacterium]
MFWRLRHFIFSYKAPMIYLKLLADRPTWPQPPNTDCLSIHRIESMDDAFEKRLRDALNALDFAAPFTCADARTRIARGELFLVANHGHEIAGWAWYASHRVHCADVGCHVQLREGHAYAYNVYVSRAHRGHGLATRLLTEADALLAARGVSSVWAMIHDWNVASRTAFSRAGYKPIGRCRALTLFGLKYRRFPGAIQG